MYVRDETLRDGNYHVFAYSENDGGILARARFSLNEFSFKDKRDCWIKPKECLVTKSIINPRNERSEKVNIFISDAYSLIRQGPNASTFEEDAYWAAGIYGFDQEKAKLKLLIHYYMDKKEESVEESILENI